MNGKVDGIEKLDLRSMDVADDKIKELLRLFPEIRTEGGKVDFERLKLALGEAVDAGKERYGMTWPGKADCFKTIQRTSLATLRPYPEESVNFDATENLIIEGDNLEVLKLLQKSYLGKVKMIYIDPPYNTGNDFIYPDNYSESLQTYLEYTGQVDAEGRKFGTNTETDGRFHSKWLNMMYPRLYLARNLLREDGVIFISIDDTEQANLRALCDLIFGEENFIANVVWQKKYAPQNDATYFSDMHDHILVYAKLAKRTKNDEQGWNLDLLPRTDSQNATYRNPDNDPRGAWASDNLSVKTYSAKNDYPITTPSGRVVRPPKTTCWRVSPERYAELLADNRIWFASDGDGVPRLKRFLSEVQDGTVPVTWWTYQDCGHNQDAKKELKELFEDADNIFDTPKPVKLITRMLQLATKTEPNALVLDFFAGSGTTGQAVHEMNLTDEGNRHFILVQLPELIEGSKQTIADLTKERLRSSGKKIKDENPLFAGDRGFKVFKLSESNFNTWNASAPHDPAALEQQLELHVNHIRDGRTEKDILFEILLKSGFPLATPVESIVIAGKTVYSAAGGALFICLERDLTLELIRAIADKKPERVVCLDAGFAGNDQLKANAVQIFKTKGVTSFKTV